MNNPSITPAPWQVSVSGDVIEVFSSHGCGRVCIVAGPDGEALENAKLIADAPLMRSVIRGVLNRWSAADDAEAPWLGAKMREIVGCYELPEARNG